LAQKITELLSLITQNANSDSLGAVRVLYQEEKDKLEKKKDKTMKLRAVSNNLMDSSRDEDDFSEMGTATSAELRNSATTSEGRDDADNEASDSTDASVDEEQNEAFTPSKKLDRKRDKPVERKSNEFIGT